MADTLGWRSLLLSRGRDIPSMALVLNHVASEAIARSIPLGVPVADSVRSLLLKREHSVPLAESVIASLARRLSLGITQFAFVLIAFVVGYSNIARLFSGLFQNEALAYYVITGMAAILLILIGVLIVLHQKGEVICSRLDFLERFTITRPLGNRLQSLRSNDSAQSSQILAVLAFFFLVWMMEFVETYIFLNALGFEATVQQALSIEAGVSLIRLAAFFLPAGIGIQETGYAGIMAAMGLGATSGVGAFLVAKRIRDIFWIVLGYAILLGKGVIPSRKKISLELTKA